MNDHILTTVPSKSSELEIARIIGFDVARALAMLGMMVVHFSLVAASERTGPLWMTTILCQLDGRASATFVILAGIGLTLFSRRAVNNGDEAAVSKIQKILVRRGVFLLTVGYVNLIIWPGDILRIYGVSLLVASRMIRASRRRLLLTAAAFALVFMLLLLLVDFEKNWDFTTMSYHDLWTLPNVFRNLFYDGFRSVFPWTGLFLFGIWLGRLDLTDKQTNSRILIAAATTAISAELISRLIEAIFVIYPIESLDRKTVHALFGTESMPALPLFLLAAAGTGAFVIALCVRVTGMFPSHVWIPLVAIGQMSLTWYFAHIVVGLGTLFALDIVGTKPLPIAAGYGLLFFVVAVLASWAWKSFSRHGPVEWIMRKTAG